jgi:hypothetical protein
VRILWSPARAALTRLSVDQIFMSSRPMARKVELPSSHHDALPCLRRRERFMAGMVETCLTALALPSSGVVLFQVCRLAAAPSRA